jgi:hypothetical protein
MARENSVIQLYGAVAGTAATIDIPDDGFLLRSKLQIAMSSVADGDGHSASLEFGSTNTIAINDTRSLLHVVQHRIEMATAAGTAPGFTESDMEYGDPGIEVFGGERIYLHNLAVAGTFVYARAILLFRFAKFVARRR